jgi:hypothetical protein
MASSLILRFDTILYYLAPVAAHVSFAWVYLSGTQLMTPERRKAVWAIYGTIYLYIPVSFGNLILS